MTLNQLQYFYQAAKTQHFNHAADNLSISQPSLSRAIASLENELGVILFERMGLDDVRKGIKSYEKDIKDKISMNNLGK